MGRGRGIVALLLLSGCALPLSGTGGDAGSRRDGGGPDAARADGGGADDDAGRPDDGGANGGDAGGFDAGTGDAGTGDAGPPFDGGSPGACPIFADPDTVLLISFDGVGGATALADTTGTHPARMINGAARTIAGPTGCGDALDFPPGNDRYAVIRDARAFDLAEGSIDFYTFISADAGGERTLFSRDAAASASFGHIRARLDSGLRMWARIQDAAGDRDLRHDPVPMGRWVHIGINWGGGMETQLWIDGVLRASAGSASLLTNMNTIAIGADNSGSADGSDPPDAIRRISSQLAIDAFRVSAARRDFSTF